MSVFEFIFPPIIALLLYFFLSYVFLPLYRQRQRYAQYMPISLPTNMHPHSLREWVLDRISAYSDPLSSRFHRRSFSGLSDEEMDPVEGLEELHEHRPDRINADNDRERGRPATRHSSGDDERRLSRDLEAGFRDDSDDEDSDERIRT